MYREGSTTSSFIFSTFENCRKDLPEKKEDEEEEEDILNDRVIDGWRAIEGQTDGE